LTERTDTRTRRALRGARKTALWAIATVVVLAAVAFGLLQTSPAKRWMAQTAAELASQPGVVELRIGAIEGLLPFSLVVRDVAVADADGEWLHVDRARMVPAWSASLLGRPAVTLLEAGTVSLQRLPSGGAGGPAPALGDALVPLDLDALRIDRIEIAEPVFGTAVAARIEGSADLLPARGRGTIRLNATLLDAAEGGSLSVDATIHGNALRARVEAREPSAVLLSHVARVSLPGYRATIEGDGPLDRWAGRVEAEAEPHDSTAGWLADLMGGPATVRSEVALRMAEGTMLHLSNLEAGSAFGTVTGGADLDLEAETLQAHARIEDADLAGTRPLLGVDVQGRATVEATADGPLDAPSAEARIDSGPLTVAGLSVDSLSGTVTATQVESLPQGSVDLALKAGFLDATLNGGYALLENDAVRLSDFTVRDSRGGRVVADLTLAPEGPPAQGRLTVAIAELAPWSDLVGRTLGGSMRGEVELARNAGGQSATFEFGAQALSVGGDGDADITVGTLSGDGTLDSILGAPSGRAELIAEGLAAGGLAADTARLSVEGNAGTLSYELAAAADGGQPAYSLDGSGTIRMDLPAWTLTIERFGGEVGEHRVTLRGPATVEGDGDALILDNLALDLDDGSVQLAGRLAPDALAATLAARDLPVALADLVGSRTGVTGRIDADLSVDAAAGRAPKGDITLAAREIVIPGLEAEDQTALEFDASGGIDGRGLSLAGTVSSAIGPPLDFDVALAAQPGGPRGLPQVDGESRLDAGAQGALDLAQAMALAPVAETVLRGDLSIAIQARGPLSRPDLTGTAELDGGYFESLTTGAVLRDISLSARLDGDTVRVTELTANDGDGGTLSGAGAMQPFAGTFGRDLEVRVDIDGFRAMRLDIATIQLSGDLRLRGTGGGLELVGDLTVDRGNINIPRQLPQDATVSAVIDTSRITVETPGGRFQGLAEPDDERADLPVALGITIDVPGQLFVRGRGLESEWGGRLDVTGTISDPRLNGELEARRGTMSALGRTFDVTKGVVAFNGPPDQPEIDFTAEADTEALTALVHVTGPPSNLAVEIDSRPAMPRDEILSRLFFGQSAGQISATQAVQLAEAAASLSGTFSGTGGITDRVRNTLGIDVLTLEGAEDGVSGSKVRAGKYLAEDVFLRVDQGLTPESSSVGVEVEVFENITIEGDVSQGGNDPSIGLNYKLDY